MARQGRLAMPGISDVAGQMWCGIAFLSEPTVPRRYRAAVVGIIRDYQEANGTDTLCDEFTAPEIAEFRLTARSAPRQRCSACIHRG